MSNDFALFNLIQIFLKMKLFAKTPQRRIMPNSKITPKNPTLRASACIPMTYDFYSELVPFGAVKV